MNYSTVASCVATCILIYTIFSIILRYGRHRHFYKLASKFPGPPALPIIGNTYLCFAGSEAFLDKFLQLGKLYRAPFRLWIGSYLIIVVNTPEQLRVVLHSPKSIDKGPIYELARHWLGTGLLTASGTKSRLHRKVMQPAFSRTILNSYIGIFAARSETIAKQMEQNLDGPEFCIHDYTSQFTLLTICETTMGVDLEATKTSYIYAEAVNKVTAGLYKRLASPWLHPDFIFNRTQFGKDQKKYIEYLHAFTDNVIQTKKKQQLSELSLRPGEPDDKENTGNRFPRRKILLDHLMEVSHNSETFSDEELREEVDTIVVTGSDTNANILSYAMLMLSYYPEIQEKVYQELCEIRVDVDGEESVHFTSEDLTRMTYLERVIKETIRLFPIAPCIGRTVSEDLELGEHFLPKGCFVVLSIMGLHRNADYWPDPLKFDPDRFLPEEVKKRDTHAYVPFSGGPRNCIGSKYAMMSMKIFLTTILGKYVLKKDNIVPVENLRFKPEVVLRPVNPITLRIERRTRKVASI